MVRISIRKQLSLLLVVFSGIGLGILAGVTWNYAQRYVLSVTESKLTQSALYKSSQIAFNLELILTASTFVTTRAVLQDTLSQYNRSSLTGIQGAQADLQDTLGVVGPISQPIVLQARVFAQSSSSPTGISQVLNATGTGAESIVLSTPHTARRVVLGDEDGGYPPELYPNLTLSSTDANVAIFQDTTIGPTSSLILGPIPVNNTFSLLSITLPVINTTERTDVLGWVTVLTSSRLISAVLDDRNDLGNGQALLFGPTNATNQFPSNVLGNPHAANASITFQLPSNLTAAIKHTDIDLEDSWNVGLLASQYPIVEQCLERNDRGTNTVLSDLDTTNEIGLRVAASAAFVPSDLVDWIVVIEEPRSSVLSPTTDLRNIILACLFSFLGFLMVVAVPIAYWAVRPIIRLRHAAEGSTEDSGYASSSEGSRGQSIGLEKTDAPKPHTRGRYWPKILGRWRKPDMLPSKPEESLSNGTRSRIPNEVPLGRCWIEDEMIDLIRKFNEMARELRSQYEMMEERVRQRTLELEQSKKAAEAANESKTIFLANVSHELRTPLNGILGMCSVSTDEEDPSKLRHSMATIAKSGELLYRTLSDLLTFSTNQVGYQQSKLDENDFDMRDLQRQIVAIFGEQAKERNIQLDFTFENESLANTVAWGDLHRILQIIINLVSNGLKFTPDSGRVSVRLGQLSSTSDLDLRIVRSFSMNEKNGGTANFVSLDRSRPRNSITESPSSGTRELPLRIEVSDTGPGIPEASQQTIFEPFIQVDAGLNRKHSGTGLGLAICSQLCTLMRGSISVSSAVGHGSTFIVDLPLQRAFVKSKGPVGKVGETPPASPIRSGITAGSTPQSKHPAPSTTIPRPSKDRGHPPKTVKAANADYSHLRVLCAEDNKVNQEVILRMLSLEGVPNTNVTLAINGQIAFDLVESDPALFDICFMDVQMPELDGHESTKKIRELGVTIPIIALTAFAQQSNVDECYASGMDYFLAKPVKRSFLREVLEKFCNQSRDTKGDLS